jgi:DNA mismatch repair ATPase MutS
MESGKLDEELRRMSEIADHLTKHPLVLFNEAFAATTEREGSEIARQVTQALLDQGCRVFFVTHLSDFAISMFEKHLANAIYLRAERGEEGARPFKLVEGQPLETSYGADLYQRIFEGREDRLSAADAKRPLVPADVV